MASLRRYRDLILAAAALLAGLALPLGAQAPSPGLYDRPVLALDPGRHTGYLRRADVDDAAQIAVTGSEDKTVRVWSVAEGKLLRTIRMPTGPGDIGKVYAVAISPDGTTIAAGGLTRWTSEEQIYLFDTATGAMTGRIAGLPSVVLDLAYSPDGLLLAAVLGSGGLRLYARNAAGVWEEQAHGAYGDASYGVAFASDGRLATTSLDNRVRLYEADGRLINSVETDRQPFGLAFNPADGRLAVGFADSPKVRLYAGATLAELPAPDVSGIDNGDLLEVAWSTDGMVLFAAGRFDEGGMFPVIAWEGGGGGPRRKLPAGLATVMSLRPLPDGGLLVAAADPWLGVIAPDTTPYWSKAPVQMDPRGQESNLGISFDGMLVEFGYEYGGQRRVRFDVAALKLIADPAADARTAAPERATLELADWEDSYTPTLDGSRLPLEPYERSRSVGIAPGGQRFLLGADWSLHAFDARGHELWTHAVPGGVWAVNVSGDGRLAIAAYSDGTIRWHKMDDGAEVLALFPFNDGTGRWVLWTPEGYYGASPGAADALGWVVNRGWDKVPDFFPITAFGGFFEPDALRHVLETMNTAEALGLAKIDRDRKFVQQVVDSPAPPGPQLHVLTVGVSRYAFDYPEPLDFADDDATGLAEALLRQTGGLYARVNLAGPLTDDKATLTGILKALRDLEERMKPDQQDVAVILFSGHGTKVGEDYYLLPSDVESDSDIGIETTALEIDKLVKVVGRMGKKGKVLVLLDACHSGAVADGTRDATPPDIAEVREALAAAGNGVIVLSSSTGGEVSRESPDWQNGAFTKAVIEALDGKGDADGDGWLTVTELEGYVLGRVRDLTENAQNPTITVPGGRHFDAPLFRTGL